MAKRRTRLAGTWTYVLMSDRTLPTEEQTRFVLRPLSGAERERYVDEMAVGEAVNGAMQIHPRTRTTARHICLTHIESVSNFPVGEAAKPWPVMTSEREAYLEMLDDEYVFEIGNEIYARSALGTALNGDGQRVGESSTPVPISN